MMFLKKIFIFFVFGKDFNFYLLISKKYWNFHGFSKSSLRMKGSILITAELGEAIALYWDASNV